MKIFVYYRNGDVDAVDGDDYDITDGILAVEEHEDAVLIANMETVQSVKFDLENSPKKEKRVKDDDLRISASIMREEYRNNPEFRQEVLDSMVDAYYECNALAEEEEILQHIADRIFDYERDSDY